MAIDSRTHNAKIKRIVTEACHPYHSFKEAEIAGKYIIRQRDLVVEMCYPLAAINAKKMSNLPWASRVEFDDIHSAALQGVFEGVNSFDVTRGTQINTHCWNWCRKRIHDEIYHSHWAGMRPPRDLMRKYMGDFLTEEERNSYIATYIRPMGGDIDEWMEG